MRNGVRAPVRPVVRGNQEPGLHQVYEPVQPIGLVFSAPLGEAGLHVDEVVDSPPEKLELGIRLVEVARMEDRDGGLDIRDQIAAGRDVGSGVLAAFHDFDRYAFYVERGPFGMGRSRSAPIRLLLTLRVDDLNAVLVGRSS